MDEAQMEPMELRHMVAKLHELRLDKAHIDDAIRVQRQRWEEEMVDKFNTKAEIEIEMANTEQAIRHERLQTYDGEDKGAVFGVAVRERVELDYSLQTALGWATDHRLALKLDVRAFEKIAKTGSIDFVLIKKIPTATIATDLSEFVPNIHRFPSEE